MASIPLQRTKAWLEAQGYHVAICERWNQWAHVRQDQFGINDLEAIRHDKPGVWGLNATGDGEIQAHIHKYLNGGIIENGKRKGETFPPNPHLPIWLSAGNRFSIIGWGKRCQDGRGSRKVWTLKIMDLKLGNAGVIYPEEAVNDHDPS